MEKTNTLPEATRFTGGVLPQRVGIVGCGWLGCLLARALAEEKVAVWGSTTREARKAEIERAGARPLLLQADDAAQWSEESLAADAWVLAFPPSGKEGARGRYPARVQAVTEAAVRLGVSHLVMIGSTSIYRPTRGWVHEDQFGAIDQDNEIFRAEQAFEAAVGERQAVVLRPSGLMGPDRHPARYLSGRRLRASGREPVNLVDGRDVAAAIVQALARPSLRGGYNICAADHPSKALYYAAICRRLGLPAPVYEGQEVGPFKLVDRSKWIRESGFSYRYSSVWQVPKTQKAET